MRPRGWSPQKHRVRRRTATTHVCLSSAKLFCLVEPFRIAKPRNRNFLAILTYMRICSHAPIGPFSAQFEWPPTASAGQSVCVLLYVYMCTIDNFDSTCMYLYSYVQYEHSTTFFISPRKAYLIFPWAEISYSCTSSYYSSSSETDSSLRNGINARHPIFSRILSFPARIQSNFGEMPIVPMTDLS